MDWEFVGVLVGLVALVGVFFVPEVRRFFRLEKPPKRSSRAKPIPANTQPVRVYTSAQDPGLPQQSGRQKWWSPRLPQPRIEANPFPEGFEHVAGARYSVVKTLFPSGRIYLSTMYDVMVDTALFDSAAFGFGGFANRGIDPHVQQYIFSFRNKEARAHFAKHAIARFGTTYMRSAMLGQRLEWDNVLGYNIVLTDEHYLISAR